MWCIRRNKKKEGASHRNLKLNWEGNTPTSSSKIWDTLSFCRVPVISRKLRWLTVSCHPCPMLSYSPSKGFQVLICVEKLHNLSKNDCVLFFISVFLKSTKWCTSQCVKLAVSPEWLLPRGWYHGGEALGRVQGPPYVSLGRSGQRGGPWPPTLAMHVIEQNYPQLNSQEF